MRALLISELIQCFGEIYDKTIRERLPEFDVPFRFGRPDLPNETALDKANMQLDLRVMQNMDFRQQMMDHSKLGAGGGIVCELASLEG